MKKTFDFVLRVKVTEDGILSVDMLDVEVEVDNKLTPIKIGPSSITVNVVGDTYVTDNTGIKSESWHIDYRE